MVNNVSEGQRAPYQHEKGRWLLPEQKYFIHLLKENANFLSNDKEQLPHETA